MKKRFMQRRLCQESSILCPSPWRSCCFCSSRNEERKKNIIYYLQRRVRDQTNPPALGNNLPVCTDRYRSREVRPSALGAPMSQFYVWQLHLCLHCAGQGVLKQCWKISFMLNNSKTPLGSFKSSFGLLLGCVVSGCTRTHW